MEEPPERLKVLRKTIEDAYMMYGIPLEEDAAYGFEAAEPEHSLRIAHALVEKRYGIPRRLDEAMWRSREQCEEIVACAAELGPLLDPSLSPLVEEVKTLAESVHERVRGYQKGGMDRAEALARTWVPQDFRASVVKFKRDRMEAKYQGEIDALMRRGGSIRDKYDMHWRQQMERRQALVDLGNATGAFLFVIKMIGGVPDEFLKFIRTMNDDNGPMEELRQTYGPTLFFYFQQLNFAHLAMALLVAVRKHGSDSLRGRLVGEKDAQRLLEGAKESLAITLEHFGGAMDQMLRIFETSPFFVTRAEFDRLMAKQGMTAAVVKKELSHRVDVGAGDAVTWYFKLEAMDINFSVALLNKDGKRIRWLLEPVRLGCDHAHEGRAESLEEGVVVFHWDNSYSWLSAKKLTWRVVHTSAGAIPNEDVESHHHLSDDS